MDRGNLPLHIGCEMGTVTAADVQPLVALEPTTSIPNSNQAFVTLGINDKYSGRPDDDVIDVAPGSANSTVVQHSKAVDASQRFGQFLFAD